MHQNWMRDYDPTTGRYLQADPLGLVDGASIYGYAGQNPVMNADPSGQCFGPFIAWAPACAAAAWAAISVYIGWLLDPDCYTWEEAGRDAAIGAAFGPLGAYGRGAASIASTETGLSAGQAANLSRFVKKLPRGAGETKIRNLPGGGKAFQAEVPGRVPGSRAVYEKRVNYAGRTTGYTKTTYDPAGNIVHTKDKITGEVLR